jgi:hypothetical protein
VAFMPVAGDGTLTWLSGSATMDVQHDKEPPAAVARALVVEATEPVFRFGDGEESPHQVSSCRCSGVAHVAVDLRFPKQMVD